MAVEEGWLEGIGTRDSPGRQRVRAPAGLAERNQGVPGRRDSRLPASSTILLKAGFVCV